MTITGVTLNWDYLHGLPEEPGGRMRLYAAYLCAGNSPSCNLHNRHQFFNEITGNWNTNLNVTTSPTTINSNAQTLPTSGGYIGFDFDSLDVYPDNRSLANAPWNLRAGDFGFTVYVAGCSNPLTKPAIPR